MTNMFEITTLFALNINLNVIRALALSQTQKIRCTHRRRHLQGFYGLCSRGQRLTRYLPIYGRQFDWNQSDRILASKVSSYEEAL